MIDNKKNIIDNVMGIEGGYVNNPNDSGGATKYGITEAMARQNGYDGNMQELDYNTAFDIYVKVFWNEMYLDKISSISIQIAAELFDSAVNLGARKPSLYFQRCLNVLNNCSSYYPDIKIDGNIGSITFDSFIAYYNKRGEEGMNVLKCMLNSLQGEFYITLAESRAKDEEFIYGWFKNRVML